MILEHRVYRPDNTSWLQERTDDTTRTITVWDEAGTVLSVTPYTAEQNAEADRRAAEEAATANSATLTAEVQAQVDALLASIAALKATRGETTDPAGTNTLRAIKNTQNSTINANPAQYLMGVVNAALATDKALIDAERAVIRLSRIVGHSLASTDSGTD